MSQHNKDCKTRFHCQTKEYPSSVLHQAWSILKRRLSASSSLKPIAYLWKHPKKWLILIFILNFFVLYLVLFSIGIFTGSSILPMETQLEAKWGCSGPWGCVRGPKCGSKFLFCILYYLCFVFSYYFKSVFSLEARLAAKWGGSAPSRCVRGPKCGSKFSPQI